MTGVAQIADIESVLPVKGRFLKLRLRALDPLRPFVADQINVWFSAVAAGRILPQLRLLCGRHLTTRA